MKAIIHSMPDCIACDQVKNSLKHLGIDIAITDLEEVVKTDKLVKKQLEDQGGAAPVVEMVEPGNSTRRMVEPRKIIIGLI